MGPKYEVVSTGAARSWVVRVIGSGDHVAEFPPVVTMSPAGVLGSIDGRAAAEYECARLNQEAEGEVETTAVALAAAAADLLAEIPDRWSALDPEYHGLMASSLQHQVAVAIGRGAAATAVALGAFQKARVR